MFDFQNKKRLININFATKKGWNFQLILINLKQRLKSRDFIFAIASGIAFISIFAENYLAENVLTAKREKIQDLKRELLYADIKIRRAKNLLKQSYKKFTNFYIPTLKEKVFYIWYHEKVIPKVWNNVYKFAKIVNRNSPFIGFVTFPNIFYLKNSWGYKYNLPSKIHKIKYQKLEVNPFLLSKQINRNFVILIEPFKIDKNFEKNIAKIKDKDIKANLLLEYGLIKYGLNPSKVHSPATLIFPVNIVLPSEVAYKAKLKELKDFCDELIINREYKKELFFRNILHIQSSIDAVCIKQIY